MKIDIHDIGDDLLDRADHSAGVVETTIIGTAEDGTRTCGTEGDLEEIQEEGEGEDRHVDEQSKADFPRLECS